MYTRKLLYRWFEWISVQSHPEEKVLGLSHRDDSHDDIEYVRFRRFHSANFVLRSDRKGDCCCMLNDRSIIEIEFFAQSKMTGGIFIGGRKYRKVEFLYSDPDDSSVCGVYRCGKLKDGTKIFGPVDGQVLKKIYRIPLFGTDAFICSVLLHVTNYTKV